MSMYCYEIENYSDVVRRPEEGWLYYRPTTYPKAAENWKFAPLNSNSVNIYYEIANYNIKSVRYIELS